MHITNLLTQRFEVALRTMTDESAQYAGMIRGTSDPKHGDFQFNAAMAMAKKLDLGQPRDVAAKILEAAELDDVCETTEVAGPGFINLTLRDDFIAQCVCRMAIDPNSDLQKSEDPQTVLIDFSSPNVAKPMHVGHVRSTVIGDSLAKIFASRGHRVITDNHLGDWGTQFGIIIYGYKHFGDEAELERDPIGHLSGLYRLVQSLIEYFKSRERLPDAEASLQEASATLQELRNQPDPPAEDKKARKKHQKEIANAERRFKTAEQEVASLKEKIDATESDPRQSDLAKKHEDVANAVLIETAKLHEGDQTNRELWHRFLPFCLDEINRIYDRLSIEFDHTLGESFYHPMLAPLVDDLVERDLAVQSDGATCVFLDGYDAPMIVRKKDGAFLYATTDLATLMYRRDEFDPSLILYVVDSRQSEHFEKLFDVSRHIGIDDIKMVHVNFGTVLGKDGRPMKTRSGTLIGLEGLLDDAVSRAASIVCDPDRLEKFDPPMDDAEQQRVAEVVGIGAIKFADLSHHRTSDYRFDVEKMVALEGNTATYVQYQYARTRSIMRRVELDGSEVLRIANDGLGTRPLEFVSPAERALALQLLRLDDAIDAAIADYAPNHLADYAIETARCYARFNDSCSVMNAENDRIADTRKLLVAVTSDVLETTLGMLGIETVARM